MLVVTPEQQDLLRNREAVKQVLRAEAATTFHPSSTCRMGPAIDSTAVVDTACRVHGIDNLRVVDASVFPWGPRCNLHAPIIAVAEAVASRW
jgi:choline dehydrogenase-like flavoprotein